MYTLNDILEVEITGAMLEEANAEANWFGANMVGGKTRPVTQNRDIIGSLAHQIVEVKFNDFGLAHTSSRISYEGNKFLDHGDTFDIQYENDFIDVKGHAGTPNTQYFYNEQFLVFQKQIDTPKFNDLTHLCFCKVAPDYSRGWIYGVISVSQFLDLAVPVTLQYQNQGIKSRQLTPFMDYVFRRGNRF
jgi:hypothetical protein